MRVFGIDPGTLMTGYGVIDGKGEKVVYIASGCIKTDPAIPLNERLVIIYDQLKELLSTYSPSAVSIENIFYSKNPQSALKLGHARGVSILAGMHASVSVFEYLPLEVKKSITGMGRADKEQVRKMIQMLLGYNISKGYDASDALAIAICHYYHHRFSKKIHTIKVKN